MWSSILAYGELGQHELLQGRAQRPQRPQVLKQWPEFLSHRWGLDEELQAELETVLTRRRRGRVHEKRSLKPQCDEMHIDYTIYCWLLYIKAYIINTHNHIQI